MSPASRVADAMSLKAVSDGSRDDLGGALDGHLGGAGAGFTGTRGELDAGVGMGYVVASAEEGRSRALPGGAESGDRVGMGPRDVEAASSRRATPEDAVALAALVSFESEEEPAGDASPFARLGVHPIAPRRSADAPSELPALTDRNDGDDASEPVLRRVGRENYRARRRRPVLVLVIEWNIEAVYRRRRVFVSAPHAQNTGTDGGLTGRTALEGSGTSPPPGTLHASIALYSSFTFSHT